MISYTVASGWQQEAVGLDVPRSVMATTMLSENEWWITGGYVGDAGQEETTDTTLIYDLEARIAIPGPNLPIPMATHSVVKVIWHAKRGKPMTVTVSHT